MKKFLYLLPAIIATPAMAHEIAADHVHVGETVLFHMSPLLLISAAIGALVAFIVVRARGSRKAGEDRHDPR